VFSGVEVSLTEAGAGPPPEEALREVEHVDVPAEKLKALPHPRLPTAESAHLLASGFDTFVHTDSMTTAGPLPPISGKKPAIGFTIVRAAGGAASTVNQEGVVNNAELLENARKITDKKYLTYFRKVPTADELANGPMGMNIHTYELVPSAVGKDIAPRFGVVTVAFFTKDEAVTQSLLGGWKQNLENIDDACVGDDKLKARVVRAVDKVVHTYCGEAFFLIDSLQVMQKLKKGYDAVAQVKIMIKRFTKDIDTCIDTVVTAELAVIRQEALVDTVNRESSDPLPSSDED
jgi:hypothetical protein